MKKQAKRIKYMKRNKEKGIIRHSAGRFPFFYGGQDERMGK